MRLITKESRALSRDMSAQEYDAKLKADRPSLRYRLFHKRGGLVVESADGMRFAYAQTPLPGFVGETVVAAEQTETQQVFPDIKESLGD